MSKYSLADRVRNQETLEDPKPALALARYQSLPMLRGLWNFASVDDGGDIYDYSEQDRVLTYNGNPVFDNNGLVPYATLDGVGDYFDRADEAGLDITGTETYVAANKRGLSFGGWFYFTDLTVLRPCIGKLSGAANQSYLVYYETITSELLYISTSGGGPATGDQIGSSVTIAIDTWYFVAATFDPSTTQNIYVNSVKDTLSVGVNASIFSGNAAFEIGSYGGGASLLAGNASYCWLCAAFLSDAQILGLYQNTRALFGV